MRKVLLDTHTHTVASGHAYSSLQEMAKAAADMGLEVLGITEHGPSVPGDSEFLMLSYQLYCFFTRQMLDIEADGQHTG